MFEVQLPALKKFQNVAGIAAGIGFVLGLLIPAVAIFSLHWHCPFGDGILQVGGFMAITGLGSAIVSGNLVAVFLIGIAKIKQRRTNRPHGRKTSRRMLREGRNSDGV
jgi:F0F1-type ATP synthase membrane subunit c/vacuolar-type H+-ATPase subunit K